MPDPTTASLTRQNKRRPLRSRWAYRRAQPRPTPGTATHDKKVTGDPSPECAGDYDYHSDYGGKPAYQRTDGEFFIYWDPEYWYWAISPVLGITETPAWDRWDEDINGTYLPYEPEDPDAIVSDP